MFALAGQGAHLFASTIRENLRLARPAADDDALWSALRRAQVADWGPSLPDGLDTFVGEEGDGLGRAAPAPRPRPGAARGRSCAGPRRAHLHLDPATARSVMNAVLDASHGKTVLLITHRSEGLDRMDEVVTLDGGVTVGRQNGGGGSSRRADAPRLATT